MSALPIPNPASSPLESDRLTLAREHLTCAVLERPTAWIATEREWEALVSAVNAPLALTPAWCRAWLATRTQPTEVRVFTFHREDELVGVVPIAIQTRRIGPLSIRLATIAGVDDLTPVQTLPVRRPWLDAALDEVAQRLFSTERCDAWSLLGVSALGETLGAVRDLTGHRDDLLGLQHDRCAGVNVSLHLPESMADYEASLSPRMRQDIDRGWRILGSLGEVRTVIAEDEDDLPIELASLIHMHTAQWEASGRPGRLTERPHLGPHYRALVHALAERDEVRALALVMKTPNGERPLARKLAFRHGDAMTCRLSARALDEEILPAGVGHVATVELIRLAHSEGVRQIDLGPGEDETKLRLGGHVAPLRSLLLVANRPSSRRATRSFCAAARAIDRTYRRAWYDGLALRLPLARRAVWNGWLGSQV